MHLLAVLTYIILICICWKIIEKFLFSRIHFIPPSPETIKSWWRIPGFTVGVFLGLSTGGLTTGILFGFAWAIAKIIWYPIIGFNRPEGFWGGFLHDLPTFFAGIFIARVASLL